MPVNLQSDTLQTRLYTSATNDTITHIVTLFWLRSETRSIHEALSLVLDDRLVRNRRIISVQLCG
jgi:hypothetical protein